MTHSLSPAAVRKLLRSRKLFSKLVFGLVLVAELSPVPAYMARQELDRVLPGFFERGECARCGNELSGVKQRLFRGFLHDLLLLVLVLIWVFASQRRGPRAAH